MCRYILQTVQWFLCCNVHTYIYTMFLQIYFYSFNLIFLRKMYEYKYIRFTLELWLRLTCIELNYVAPRVSLLGWG